MAKHSAPGQQNWGVLVITALVLVLLVVGGISAYQVLNRGGGDSTSGGGSTSTGGVGDDAEGESGTGSGGEEGANGPDSCAQVTVWSAPELMPAVEAAVDRATDDCHSFAVVSRETAIALAALKSGEGPDVWLPSSTAWAQLAQAADVDLEIGDPVAASPVLLAGHPALVEGLGDLGITPESTFPELVQRYQEAVTGGGSEVSLRLGDPRTDPASLALLTSSADQLGGLAEPGSPGRNLLVLLAQTSIKGDPLAVVRSEPTTLVPVTEQQFVAAVGDGQELAGMALEGGVGTVTMPLVRLGDAGHGPGVDALEGELTSEQAAADLLELGLRAGADAAAPQAEGLPEGLVVDLTPPDAQTTAVLAQTWAVIAPQSRILTLIDISGSMEVVVGDGLTRIDLTRQAAQTALSVVPGQTAIGLWYFATALDGDGDDDVREVAPVRPLNEDVRNGVTQKDLLLAETEKLTLDILEGDTGLHDALWAGYQYMQESYSPDAISSVLLLTDGINDDSTGGLSEDEAVDLLTEAREAGDRPVTVVLIGIGEDVDAEALDRLATAAGGESLVLRDPRELPQVFVDVVARRAS